MQTLLRTSGAVVAAALSMAGVALWPLLQGPKEGRPAALSYHEQALADALEAAKFSAEATLILQGEVVARAHDQFEWSPQNGSAPAASFDASLHCVRRERETHEAALRRVARFLAERRESCIAALKAGDKKGALLAIGQSLHAAHALLAHSNWVDLPGAEQDRVLDVLLGLESPAPSSLRIAAMAPTGGSPRNDPYGIEEFDKSGPRSSPDASASIAGDTGKTKHRAVVEACAYVGRRVIERIEMSDKSAGHLWAEFRAYRGEGNAFPGELAFFAREKGLEDAAFASILVAPDERIAVTNPFDVSLSVANLGSAETRTVEAHGSLVLGAKDEKLAVTGVGTGSTIIAVSHVAERKRPEEATVGIVTIRQEPIEEIPLYGAATPLLVVDGNAPKGGSLEFQVTDDKDKVTSFPAQTLLVVTTAEGRIRQSVCRFVNISVSFATIRRTSIVLLDSAGIEIARKDVRVRDGSIKLSLQPVEGRPGTPATITLDGTAYRAAMSLDRPVFAASDLMFRIDYSRSGGATGPRVVPFPASGSVKFEVTRGTIPGAFQLVVIPMLRASLFSDTTCGGGLVKIRGAAVSLSPHARVTLPGCPYCGAKPLRHGAPRPERCPGSSYLAQGRTTLLSAHAWGRERECPVCRG